jgi:hypothetical protein
LPLMSWTTTALLQPATVARSAPHTRSSAGIRDEGERSEGDERSIRQG